MANVIAVETPGLDRFGKFRRSGIGRFLRRPIVRAVGSVIVTIFLASLLVFCIELVARGSLEPTLGFFTQPFRPGWTTIALFAIVLVGLDALLGRPHNALIAVAPVMLGLAFITRQKAHYLGDPLYPTDFLYSRQIMELMPLLVRERPWTAVGIVVAILAAVALLVFIWRIWRRRVRVLSARGRFMRLAVAVPALTFFVSIMDYATFSWTRDRLQIIPMMWDQKENYNSNGFALAFALNVPMAKVAAPEGYSADAIAAIPQAKPVATAVPEEKPDIIVVMSESFWDPTLLPGVKITPDPIPTVREIGSGHIFSPEFGGMTANVEFEALTGFSNAFLPYGSIPYQQYVRQPMPSLATFLRSEGYDTRAFHPFGGWFWNRTPVYEAFGFDRFQDEEELHHLEKRGPLASDAALTEEIIREADASEHPFFYFAVSLQSHGPYEPNRYPDATHQVAVDASGHTRGSIQTYAEGVADADKSLKRLIEWAEKRERPTVIAFFGDHLPPLGPAYVETGFLKDNVPERREPVDQLALHRNTPLVVWSNRSGPQKDLGDISPAFLPYFVLKSAGISHPYYTGFLAEMHERYKVVDRHVVIKPDGASTPDWARAKEIDPAIRDFGLLQYDLMFGKQHGAERFFPEAKHRGSST